MNAVHQRRRRATSIRAVILCGVGLLGFWCATPPLQSAQSDERFRGRLSVLPIDFATAPSISGWGEAQARLTGRVLAIAGTFEGLSSPATVAHIHQAPPARRGPVAFPIEVSSASPATSGELSGALELTDAQIRALRNSDYYVQIHTENNPGGEIRGWLMPQSPR
jgi:hypothetical protein